MTTLFAAAVLAASLAADPAPPAKPEAPAAPAAPHAGHAMPAMPAMPAGHAMPAAAKLPASPEALKDAQQALLGPCSPQMATAKVTAVEVLDGNQLNARLEKEKSKKAKAEPDQRFIAVSYAAGGKKGSSVRQVSTHHMLTTEQAKVLVGEKLCVFKE
jgi:hypothetical protein